MSADRGRDRQSLRGGHDAAESGRHLHTSVVRQVDQVAQRRRGNSEWCGIDGVDQILSQLTDRVSGGDGDTIGGRIEQRVVAIDFESLRDSAIIADQQTRTIRQGREVTRTVKDAQHRSGVKASLNRRLQRGNRLESGNRSISSETDPVANGGGDDAEVGLIDGLTNRRRHMGRREGSRRDQTHGERAGSLRAGSSKLTNARSVGRRQRVKHRAAQMDLTTAQIKRLHSH